MKLIVTTILGLVVSFSALAANPTLPIVCADTLGDSNALNVVKILDGESGNLEMTLEIMEKIVPIPRITPAYYLLIDAAWSSNSNETLLEPGKMIQFTPDFKSAKATQVDANSIAFADSWGGVLLVDLKTQKATYSGPIKRLKNSDEMKDPQYDPNEKYIFGGEGPTHMNCTIGSDPLMSVDGSH